MNHSATSRISRRSESSKPQPTHTADDILASLRELIEDKPNAEGMTTVEIAEALGWNLNRTKDLMRQAHRLGKLKVATAYRTAYDGRSRPVPVYTLRG